MISRFIVIAMAFAAAAYRLWEGAWLEGVGLLGLGGGLVCLKIGDRFPANDPRAARHRARWRRFAWAGFAVTAAAVLATVLLRQRNFS